MTKSSGVLLLAAAAALAQAPADRAASVAGTVTNSVTGEPIVRAHVALRGATADGKQVKYGAMTDTAGKFSITGLPPGSYGTQAERVGFTAGALGAPGKGFELKAGDARSDLKLQLLPLGAITGRVLTSDGQPAEWIRVFVETTGGTVAGEASADDRGVYRVGGLRPGQYRIKADPQAMAPNLGPEIHSDGSQEIHYIATWYPGAANAKSGAKVAVQAGAETPGIDVRLVRGPIVRVSGTVRNIPGSARPVVELRRDGSWYNVPQVKPDGSFTIWRLDPGTYTLRASCAAGGQTLRSAPLEIQVAGGDLDHIDLGLLPPLDISGTVEYEGDEIRTGDGKMPLRRVTLEDLDHRVSVPSVDIVNGESFKLEGMPAGRFSVRITPGPAYVKSMRIGTASIDGSTLDLRNGTGGASLTLVLSAATGSVTGTVTAEEGSPASARVALIPEDPDAGLYASVAGVAASGAYDFEGIRPGRYKLIALDPSDGRNLDDLEERVEHIEVMPRDRLMQDLTVPSQFQIGVRK